MLQITSGPDLRQPWCQTRACGNAGADISVGVLLLLLVLLQHQWKMRDAEVKGDPQGSALVFQPYYLGWGSFVLCCAHQLSLLTLCLKEPNSLRAPGAAPLLCCATAAAPDLPLNRLKEQHFGCPGELELEERCGFGVENDQFSVIFAKDNGCLG